MTTPFPYPVGDSALADVPAGFRPMQAGGPYFQQLGPLYVRDGENGTVVLGLRITASHLNIQGVTHGGMLATVADGALGINVSIARGRRGGQVTVSLTADYLSGGREGEWLEAHVVITRLGKRLAYASCDLKVGGRHLLRSSAVFAVVDRAPAAAAEFGALQDG